MSVIRYSSRQRDFTLKSIFDYFSLNLMVTSVVFIFGLSCKKLLKDKTSIGAGRSNGKPIGLESGYFRFGKPQYDDALLHLSYVPTLSSLGLS